MNNPCKWAMLLAVLLGCAAAEARTTVNVDVDLREGRPLITDLRRVRRFGWHSGTHFGPYTDSAGRERVGWHTGSHLHWYALDVPVLGKVDPDWEVFVRLGGSVKLRVRGDAETSVREAVSVGVPGGTIVGWALPDGRMVTSGPPSDLHRRFVGDGWSGFDLGNSIIVMDIPGSRGVEVFLRRRTKDLAPPEPPKEREKRLEQERARRERDALLDEGDRKFVLGLYPQAAILYQRAMKLDVTDAIARFAVAHALFALGQYATAGDNVRLGLDKFPDWGLVRLELPKFYKNEDTFREKLAALANYVADHPGDGDARLLLGYCLYFSGRRGAALGEFRKLAALPGGDKHAELFLKLEECEPIPADEPASKRSP